MSFQENIQQWVMLDNQLKLYNDKIKQIREKKNELTEKLVDQADQNGYTNSVIQITDGKLKFTNTKVQSPLTFKYIDSVLSSSIRDEKVKDQLIQKMKENREVKVVSDLKRYSK